MGLLKTLPHIHSGKVRDTYLIPGDSDHLLMVASDRLSTHNVKHDTLVRQKGELLTALTVFYTFDVLRGIPTHLEAYGEDVYRLFGGSAYDELLEQNIGMRAMVVRKHTPTLREFIYRSYLTGSLYKAIQKQGTDPYGLGLTPELPLMYRFPEPIFTPTEKSENDEPVPSKETWDLFIQESMVTSLAYGRISDYLATRGITLIDGKFEAAGRVLIDEWGTGDCCRMAFEDEVREGEDPPFLDKEVFRKEAERIWSGGEKYPITFSDEVTASGGGRYHQGFEAITGVNLSSFQKNFM